MLSNMLYFSCGPRPNSALFGGGSHEIFLRDFKFELGTQEKNGRYFEQNLVQKKIWGAPDTHRPKFVRKRFSKFSIFGLFSAKITTFWVLYPYRVRKWDEQHEKNFSSFLDPIWCGPKKFRPPHPKKVCFRGCRIVHKNNVFVLFSTKFNVLGILVYKYDVEVG